MFDANKKFKSKIRIPTEMYSFVEVDVEGTSEEITEAYNRFKTELNSGEGLSPKLWRRALDRYLTTGDGDVETYLAMSVYQKNVIQEIKRAYKRINSKDTMVNPLNEEVPVEETVEETPTEEKEED